MIKPSIVPELSDLWLAMFLEDEKLIKRIDVDEKDNDNYENEDMLMMMMILMMIMIIAILIMRLKQKVRPYDCIDYIVLILKELI